MVCIDFLLQVILFPSAALSLSNASRLFRRLAHRNQDFSRLANSFAISCRHTGVKVSRCPWVKARAPAPSYSESSSGVKVFVMRPQTRKSVFLWKFAQDLRFWWNLRIDEILLQMVSPSKDFRFWSHFRRAAHNFSTWLVETDTSFLNSNTLLSPGSNLQKTVDANILVFVSRDTFFETNPNSFATSCR